MKTRLSKKQWFVMAIISVSCMPLASRILGDVGFGIMCLWAAMLFAMYLTEPR